MALRDIMIVDRDDVLRKFSRAVKNINPGVTLLLGDMADTMLQSGGVGLAAPQVGVLRRVIIVDKGDGLAKLINPEIIDSGGEQTGYESCLSIPGIVGLVTRPQHVVVAALDERGERVELAATGLIARTFCHEIDHLDGILFTDRAKQGSLRKVSDHRDKTKRIQTNDILL